jgi:hypothetical protein
MKRIVEKAVQGTGKRRTVVEAGSLEKWKER